MERVIVVGSSGQDGRILCGSLRRRGHSVLRIARNTIAADEPFPLTAVDVARADEVLEAVRFWRADRVYYLAAFNHSSEEANALSPAELLQRSFQVHVTGLVHFLEAIRLDRPMARLFYAASSLVFGQPAGQMVNEDTPCNPTCAYGITKAAGVHCCRYYRNAHGIFASCGLLFNHESSLRRPQFVSQKIIRGALAIHRGESSSVVLGDLDARIDWGAAEDYVEAMQRIVEHRTPEDFVIATGEAHSVKEFVELVFSSLGLDWRQHVHTDPSLLARRRPTVIGDASKLRSQTGWRPTQSFHQMVEKLVTNQRNGT